MQKVDRIWYERGDWRSITEDSLKESIENKQDVDGETTDAISDLQSVAPTPPPGFDIVKVRDSVVNKLLYVVYFFLLRQVCSLGKKIAMQKVKSTLRWT